MPNDIPLRPATRKEIEHTLSYGFGSALLARRIDMGQPRRRDRRKYAGRSPGAIRLRADEEAARIEYDGGSAGRPETFDGVRVDMFNFPEAVPDDELEAGLTAALRSGGGKITRAMSCETAGVVSEHLVTWQSSTS
jgi:hypothetical protein